MEERNLFLDKMEKVFGHKYALPIAFALCYIVDYTRVSNVPKTPARIIKAEIIDINNDGLNDIIHTYENGSKITLYARKNLDGKIFYNLED